MFSSDRGFWNVDRNSPRSAALSRLDRVPEVEWWISSYPICIGVNTKCGVEKAKDLAKSIARELVESTPKGKERHEHYAFETIKVLPAQENEDSEEKIVEVTYTRDFDDACQYRITVFDAQRKRTETTEGVGKSDTPAAGPKEPAAPRPSVDIEIPRL